MSTVAIPRMDAAGIELAAVEDLLIALADREDVAGPEERARLRASRRALELELSRRLS
jgi:hypothetical protein